MWGRRNGVHCDVLFQISSLGGATSNAAWALADMKQGQAQTSADFSAFKVTQPQAAANLGAIKPPPTQFMADLISMKKTQAQESSELSVVELLQSQIMSDMG